MMNAACLVVRLDVLGEMVGAHELLVALRALEALLARVRPPVPLQLVGAREPERGDYGGWTQCAQGGCDQETLCVTSVTRCNPMS